MGGNEREMKKGSNGKIMSSYHSTYYCRTDDKEGLNRGENTTHVSLFPPSSVTLSFLSTLVVNPGAKVLISSNDFILQFCVRGG